MEERRSFVDTPVDRGKLLRLGAAAAAGPLVAGALVERARAASPHQRLEDVSIAELQAAMTSGSLTTHALVQQYLARIENLDRKGPNVNSVLELNPDAEVIARSLDAERHAGHVRGPLHGIPVLIKGNIDTHDKMTTTAGSLALVGTPPALDATVAKKLRDAGAIILGKANLSEWANFRSFHSASGWSGQGGQTRNPYILDRNPCGSSSGSGAAVAAAFSAGSLGTETDGSIVCPSSANGVVGIKPTVGLTSRAGVVPIAHSQDTVGPHGKTVADAAAILGALTGVDPRDPDTAASAGKFKTNYTQYLDAHGLQGARIGVMRSGVTGYSEETDGIFEDALEAMKAAGATLVDPADLPTIDEIATGAAEIVVLVYEFKRDLNAYLATRTGVPIKTLADAIAFNEANAARELKWFLQEWFELAESDPFDKATYDAALLDARRLGGADGIDATLKANNLQALVAPTGSPAWPTDLVNGDHFLGASSAPSAIAGYPIINVPAGDAFGLPVGISFIGTAWSEPTLIKLAAGFEAATKARKKPEFRTTLPVDGPFQGLQRRAASGGRARDRAPSLPTRWPIFTGRL
ncbi:MAG: amidase [Actinobacteria bacterium]|nr:amidase [Actinomycetota bacterium]